MLTEKRHITFSKYVFIFETWGGRNPSSLGEYFSIMWGMTYRKSSNSIYDIECHKVFCAKYRYRVLCGTIAARCIAVLTKKCSANYYIGIISGNVSPDHVHLIISVSQHLSASKVVQYTKEQKKTAVWMQGIKETLLGAPPVSTNIFCSDIRTNKCKKYLKIYRRTRSILQTKWLQFFRILRVYSFNPLSKRALDLPVSSWYVICLRISLIFSLVIMKAIESCS